MNGIYDIQLLFHCIVLTKMESGKGILIYIIIEANQAIAYQIKKTFDYNMDNLVIVKLHQESLINKQSIDSFYLKIIETYSIINRIGYGFDGQSTNNKLRSYFKMKFNRAHKIGVKAIRIKFAQSITRIANAFAYGKFNLAINESKAFYYYQQALVWWQLPSAMISVAYRLAFGKGTDKDMTNALNMFEKVLCIDYTYYHKQANPKFNIEIIKGEACYYLGFIYQHGWGVEIDMVKARNYYEQGKALCDTRCMQLSLNN